MKQFNHAAIWTTILIHQVLLFLWYSSSYLLRPWADALHVNVEDILQHSPITYIIAIFASVVTCYLLSWILIIAKRSTIGDGIAFSIVLWMGYGGATLAQQYAMVGIGFQVILLDLLFTLACALVSGIVIGGWMKKTRN